MTRRRFRLPWTTLALVAAAILAQIFSPQVGHVLEWRSDWWTTGQIWRCLSGHLLHWGWEHFVWDALVFATLGTILEIRNRRLFRVTLVSAVALAEIALRLAGRFDLYRGLSACDMAVFALVAQQAGRAGRAMLRRGERRRGVGLMLAGAGAWLGAIGKSLWEFSSETALFVSVQSGNFAVATETHVAGLMAPLLSCLLARAVAVSQVGSSSCDRKSVRRALETCGIKLSTPASRAWAKREGPCRSDCEIEAASKHGRAGDY